MGTGLDKTGRHAGFVGPGLRSWLRLKEIAIRQSARSIGELVAGKGFVRSGKSLTSGVAKCTVSKEAALAAGKSAKEFLPSIVALLGRNSTEQPAPTEPREPAPLKCWDLDGHDTTTAPGAEDRELTTPEKTFKQSFLASGYHTSEELVRQTIASKNLFGSGTEASIYKIPQMPGYLLRVKHDLPPDNHPIPLRLVDHRSIAHLDNVSVPVAKIGELEILRHLPGVAQGMPFSRGQHYDIKDLPRYEANLRSTAALHQDVFNEYVRTVNDLVRAGYGYDGMANNILLEPPSANHPHGIFNFIDLCLSQPDEPVDFGQMALQLLDLSYLRDLGIRSISTEAQTAMRIILKKLAVAVKKEGCNLPLNPRNWVVMACEVSGVNWP